MLVAIPNLLTPQQVAYARQKLDAVQWKDGAATAGVMAKKVKQNRQVDQSDPVGNEIGQMILAALRSNDTFVSAAQPLKVLPPKFNRYEGGEHYGAHIDNAVMDIPGSGGLRLRADWLVATAQLYTGEEVLFQAGLAADKQVVGADGQAAQGRVHVRRWCSAARCRRRCPG